MFSLFAQGVIQIHRKQRQQEIYYTRDTQSSSRHVFVTALYSVIGRQL